MTLRVLVALAVLLFPLAARAHVGSPNVFFEGKAGPHALNVMIRPPVTLPGVAQIDIRVPDDDVTRVTVLAEFEEAGAEATPAPTLATRVAGDPHLYSTEVWLLRRGTYGVRITLESPRGSGTAAVPLQAAALVSPVMSPALAGALLALAALLFVWAVWIAAAVARDRARRGATTLVAALMFAAAIYGGFLRWRTLDENFSNALYRPVPVEAKIETDGPIARLRLEPIPGGAPDTGWETLVTDHGKLMHLFLVRENTQDAFAHLHPIRRDARTFEGVLPPLPAGSYELYAELTYENGTSQTLVAKLALPETLAGRLGVFRTAAGDGWCLSGIAPRADAPQPFAFDFDDSWHIGRAAASTASPMMGGGRMVFETADPLVVDRETTLRFAAITPEGTAATLEPYMGMLGHAVVRRADGGVFAHLHPAGSYSMAAAALLARGDGAAAPTPAQSPEVAREVAFPYAFPRAGDYRIWVQVRTRGIEGVLTGVFDVKVVDAT